MFLLFVVYAALAGTPEEWINIYTEWPMQTLEDCTKKAEVMAVSSMREFPELANYKFYICVKETI